ncbi:MAG: hypothetical protein HQL73_02755 [Magnetococcales bacterium]|nr:hypothetical protein [Magnetococcales bacterium]
MKSSHDGFTKEKMVENSFSAGDLLSSRYDYDQSGNIQYIGYASPGSATGDSVWMIKKIEYDDQGRPSAILFAGGQSEFASAWDGRAHHTYS